MDVLRSFHATRTFIDQARTVQTNLRWYPARPGAKAFPVQHAFGSPVWEPNRGEFQEGPSCLFNGLKWRGSRFAAPDGQHYHGELDWFRRGLPSEVVGDLEAFSRPQCPGYAVDVLIDTGLILGAATAVVIPATLNVGVRLQAQAFTETLAAVALDVGLSLDVLAEMIPPEYAALEVAIDGEATHELFGPA